MFTVSRIDCTDIGSDTEMGVELHKVVINFHCIPSRITTMCILSLYIIHTINEIMSQTCGTITEYSE